MQLIKYFVSISSFKRATAMTIFRVVQDFRHIFHHLRLDSIWCEQGKELQSSMEATENLEGEEWGLMNFETESTKLKVLLKLNWQVCYLN